MSTPISRRSVSPRIGMVPSPSEKGVREPLWAAEKGMSKKVLITFNFFLHNLGLGDLSAASLLLLFGSKYVKYLMI